MAGPWEKYGQKEEAGPWAKYAAPTQDKPKESVASDAGKSSATGLAKGMAGIVGLPGDLESLSRRGVQYLADHVLPDSMANVMRAGLNTPTGHPGSQELNDDIQKATGLEYHKPQYPTGELAETISSFIPAAASPGSIAARAARVVVPGATSEAAGQLTKGSKYEPLARAAGAVLGGGLTGVGEAMASGKTAVLSSAQLKAAKDAAYKLAEQHGVVIKDTAWNTLANDIKLEMAKKPFRPDLHPGAVSALDTIASEKGPVTLESADAIRQVVNDAISMAGKNNGGDVSRASKIKSMLDDFLDNITPADTVSGDPKVAVPILKEARSLAQREFKSKEIQKLIDLAENQASSNYSASGMEQALRVQFKNFNAKLIKEPALAKSFTKEERRAIQRVAEGGPVGNTLRYFGKLAPTNVISSGVGAGGGAALGSYLGGPEGAMIGAMAIPTAGSAARSGASALTSRNAKIAEELMRAGPQNKPGAAQIAGQVLKDEKQKLLLSALLSQGSH